MDFYSHYLQVKFSSDFFLKSMIVSMHIVTPLCFQSLHNKQERLNIFLAFKTFILMFP